MSALEKIIAVMSPSSSRGSSPVPGSSRPPSSPAACQSKPAPREKPVRAARLLRKSYAPEPDSDVEDISHSESEEEWVRDVDDSEEFEEELAHVKKSRTILERKEQLAPVTSLEREEPETDTDDEEDDDEKTRDRRTSIKNDLRQQIREILAKDVPVDNAVWTPDEDDENLLIVAPVCKQGKNWSKFNRKEQDDVRQAVLEGNALGKKLSIVAETPRLYLSGFKKFMGLYQDELCETFPESLVDGKLHLRQFFTFREAHSMEVPQGIDHLLEKVESPGMRTFAFCGFKQLCQSPLKFLATSEAKSMFLKRTREEYEMGELDLKAEAIWLLSSTCSIQRFFVINLSCYFYIVHLKGWQDSCRYFAEEVCQVWRQKWYVSLFTVK